MISKIATQNRMNRNPVMLKQLSDVASKRGDFVAQFFQEIVENRQQDIKNKENNKFFQQYVYFIYNL